MNLSNSEIDICVNNFNYINIFTFLLPFLNLGNHMFYLKVHLTFYLKVAKNTCGNIFVSLRQIHQQL